jgi:hypothetical protein
MVTAGLPVPLRECAVTDDACESLGALWRCLASRGTAEVHAVPLRFSAAEVHAVPLRFSAAKVHAAPLRFSAAELQRGIASHWPVGLHTLRSLHPL